MLQDLSNPEWVKGEMAKLKPGESAMIGGVKVTKAAEKPVMLGGPLFPTEPAEPIAEPVAEVVAEPVKAKPAKKDRGAELEAMIIEQSRMLAELTSKLVTQPITIPAASVPAGDVFTVKVERDWQFVKFLNGKPSENVLKALNEARNTCPGGGGFSGIKAKKDHRLTWHFNSKTFDVVGILTAAGAILAK
jgi:hypothetical protein